MNVSIDFEISKREDLVLISMSKALLKEIELSKKIHKHVWNLLENIDGKVKLEDFKLHERFYLLQGLRSLTHLRSVIILIQKGYAAEVASLGCNLLEIFMQIKYVNEDNNKAPEWFSNNNLYKPAWGIASLFEHFQDSNLKEHYACLAKIKHSQFYGTGINLKQLEQGWNFDPGPSTDEWLLRWVLSYSTSSFMDTVARIKGTFEKYHDNYIEWNKTFNKIDSKFRISYKEMARKTKKLLDEGN